MSELDVIVIHIRAEQAAEYERLFAERELPRVQGAGRLHQRPDIPGCLRHRPACGHRQVRHRRRSPSHAQHSRHDADPGFQEFNRLADAFQPEDPLVYGGQVLHAV
jgi:hypothetical protein